MVSSFDLAWFTEQLKNVLTALYDPSVMHSSPLTKLFEVDQRRNPMFALQHIILDAIEALRPGEETPQGSRNWRIYQILRRRYTEQRTQREVAVEVGLGLRHYQREEGLARQALAEYLWTFHNLETKVRNLSLTSPVTSDSNTPLSEHTPSRAEELEQLEESVPTQIANTEEIIQEVLETLKPLLDSEKVTVTHMAQNEPPLARLKIPIFRQALLSIISMAIRYVPGGKVFIQTDVQAQQMFIRVHTTVRDTAAGPARDHARAVRMVEQLIGLCDGSLEITFGEDESRVFKSRLGLPALEELQVLVIDDNEDTRQLFRRYLSGSRYRFVGAANAADGLELAQKMDPQFIVLDVMMPGKDGWALLGQLRTHPKTCHIPVILCTILPHEGLAHDLGAVDFLQKPVNRPALLSALDRQLSQLGLKPC